MTTDRPVVLIVVKSFPPAFRSGGPGRSISSMVELLGADFDFRVLTSMNDNGYDLGHDGVSPNRWEDRNGAAVFAVANDALAPLRILRELRRLEPDVVYLNSFFNPVFAMLPLVARRARQLAPSRTVIAPRGEFSTGALGLKSTKKRIFLAWFQRLGLGRGVVWHATSPLEAEAIRSQISGNPSIATAPVLRSLAPPASRSAPAPDGVFRVVLLSKIDRMKNVACAIEAVARCSSKVHLTIAGPVKEQDYWSECRDLIDDLGIDEQVSYLGAVRPDEVIDFLHGFDAFLLPTMGENFGHVILEALASGLPAVISDQTRWSNIEQDGAGFVVDVHDVAGFAHAIDRLAGHDAEQRSNMSLAASEVARRYLEDDHSIETNRRLLELDGPRVAAVHYSFPVTTQSFHHRRHRALLEVGALQGVYYVKSAPGHVEHRSAAILGHASRIGRRGLVPALPLLLRPRVLRRLISGVVLATSDNAEGGRRGFVWQALHGLMLGRQLRHGDATVVHASFATGPATIATFAALVADLPMTMEVHSPASAIANPDLLASKLKAADRVFAISHYTENLIHRLCPEASVSIVHCGLDVADVDDKAVGPTHLATIFDVMSVGSLVPKKGHANLIRASAALAARLPHTVAIAGEGPLRTELQELIDGLCAPVTLLGEVPPDELTALRRGSRVGVLASVRTASGDEDGVPVALMEFMAAGVPVIGSDLAGIAELLDDGAAGRLVTPGDVEELAAAIGQALADETWRSTAVDAGRQRILDRFDNANETARLLDEIRSLGRGRA